MTDFQNIFPISSGKSEYDYIFPVSSGKLGSAYKVKSGDIFPIQKGRISPRKKTRRGIPPELQTPEGWAEFIKEHPEITGYQPPSKVGKEAQELWKGFKEELKAYLMAPILPFVIPATTAVAGYKKAKETGEPFMEAWGESLREVGREAKKGIKEYFVSYKHPWEHIKKYPISTVLDIATLFTAGGTLLAKTGTVASKLAFMGAQAEKSAGIKALSELAIRSGERMAKTGTKMIEYGLPYTYITKPLKWSEKSFIKAMEKGIPREELGIPARIGRVYSDVKAGLTAQKLRARSKIRLSHAKIQTLNKIAQEKKELGNISPEEISAVMDYAQIPYPELPESVKIIMENSPQAQKLYQILKKHGEDLKKTEIKEGFYTREIAERRLYKPYAVKIEKEKLLDKITAEYIDEHGKMPTPEILEKKFQERKEELIAKGEWDARVETTAELLKQAYKDKADNLAYIYSLTELAENKGIEDLVAYLGNVEHIYPPGFARAYRGGKIAPINWEKAMVVREWMQHQALAQRQFMNDVIQTGLKEGWLRRWAGEEIDRANEVFLIPDAHRVYLETVERVLKKINWEKLIQGVKEGQKNRWKAISQIIKKAIEDKEINEPLAELSKEFTQLLDDQLKSVMRKGKGLRWATTATKMKYPVYVIPKRVASQLERESKRVGIFNGMRLFWDLPLNFWRYMVLGLSPRWYLYNTVGNIIFNLLYGTTKGYKYALEKKWEPYVPPEVGMGFVRSEAEFPIGATRGLWFLKRPEKIVEVPSALYETVQVVDKKANVWGSLAKFTRKAIEMPPSLNEKIEYFFKKALFLEAIDREARKALMKDTLRKGWFLNKELVEKKMMELLKNPDVVSKALDAVGDFMFNYWNMSRYEKEFLRRIIPFWSWYRNIFRLVYWTLPMKYPGRTRLLLALGEIGKSAWRENLKDLGIDPDLLTANMPWMEHAVPIGYDPKEKKVIFWNTAGANPFATVSEMDFNNLIASTHPVLKVGAEQAFGKDVFREKEFDSPFVYKDPLGRLWVPTDKPPYFKRVNRIAPPLLEHFLRQIPHYNLLVKPFYYKMKYGTVPYEYGVSAIYRPLFKRTKEGEFAYTRTPAELGMKLFGFPTTKISPEQMQVPERMIKALRTTIFKEYQKQTGGR